MDGIKTVQIKMTLDNHRRLTELKNEIGCSNWDNFILALAESYPREFVQPEEEISDE